ncbi:MAG: helix-turn-helix domain-containing protein [Flavobacterium sp.]
MVLIVSISVVLLSLLLIYNNFSKNKNSLYICGSLICMCIIAILHHFTVIEANVFWIAIFSGHSLPLGFLIGPFLYFYTRNALAGKIIYRPIDSLHYIPFLVVLISIFPYYFTPFDQKLKLAQLLVYDANNMITKINFSWLYPSYWNILLRPLFLLTYTVFSVYLIFSKLKLKKTPFSFKTSESYLKWLVVINFIFLLIAFLYSLLTANFFLRFVKNREEINGSPFSYLVYVMMCSLPILMLVFPEILYDVKKNKPITKKAEVERDENHDELVKKADSMLEFIKKEANLMDPNFGVDSICEALALTKEEVNYCFSAILKTKLATLKKELRVELAKKELQNGMLQSLSMEGIWVKAGFTSKTSFFVAFKEVTGLTPLEYVKFVVEETPSE